MQLYLEIQKKECLLIADNLRIVQLEKILVEM